MSTSYEQEVDVLAHLYGLKIRGSAPAAICDAAAELVSLLSAGSLQLADDAEEALEGYTDHLGIRFVASDHAVDRFNKIASDKPIFRDVMAQFVIKDGVNCE